MYYMLTTKILTHSLDPIRAYKRETITLELPGDITIFDIDWFSIYDVESKENYGSVIVPSGLNVPPSLVKIIVSLSTLNLFF